MCTAALEEASHDDLAGRRRRRDADVTRERSAGARGAPGVSARPRLTWWDFCIVRASYRLSGDAKHVWEVVRELDGRDGCFMSPVELAQQVGIPLGSLNDHRAELQRLGLLARATVAGSKLDRWAATLPFDPGEPPSGSKAKRQWIRECAEALDRHIQETRERAT